MRIAVLGAGAWGSALAASFSAQHEVALWTRSSADREALARTRTSRYLPEVSLPAAIAIASDLADAVREAQAVVVATSTAGLRPTLAQLAATIRYHDLGEGMLTVGGVRVVAQYLNHPALTLGYRLEADGVAVVYACDHEPHMRDQPEVDAAGSASSTGEVMLHAEDARHVALLEGADLVITAEGGIDFQTPRGKIPAEVAARAKRFGLPVVAIVGTVGKEAQINHDHGIDAFLSILQSPCTLDEAIEKAEELVTTCAEDATRLVMIGRGVAGGPRGENVAVG